MCLEDTFRVTLNAWYSNAPNGVITAKIIVLCVLFQVSFTQYSRSSCNGTHMHILALALAQTYPNNCPSSCWTSNCFVVKYMDRYIDPVSIMTLCRLWQTSQPEIYCETDIFCSEINTSGSEISISTIKMFITSWTYCLVVRLHRDIILQTWITEENNSVLAICLDYFFPQPL